ncbi:MAG: hypothetical protein K8R18_11635 [Parvibaculum sp.]|uniref:DUF1302 family protein n=1 Tax=Parvibaculum sp. TaxID=2024848 RepID=UPI0025E8F593|nr:DUF1302 family protein [Parvibaculum sp.]MCE9650262.1 hypothetical protein [Parvibaculum sp.]
MKTTRALALLIAAGLAMTWQQAQAIDFDISGMVRQEAAVKVTDKENRMNEQENLYHGHDSSNALDLFATRVEIEASAKLSEELVAKAKLRAFGDWGLYENASGRDFFGSPTFGGNRGNRLEVSGDQYMVDFPSLYLDFNKGPVWIRAGNQQIAWGEALFFRVLDVPNGLDLRRHFILDPASEEYSDKRVASPGVRGSVRLLDQYEVEGFAQMFSPSILPNPGTPYNFIPDQFTVHTSDDANRDWNFGGRIQARYFDALSVQAIAVHRTNPDGVFRWRNDTDPLSPFFGLPFSSDPAGGVASADEWFKYAGSARLDGVNGVCQSLGAPNGTPGICDSYASAKAYLTGTFGAFGPLRGHIDREFKRENVFGLGANYVFSGEPDTLFDQLVMRGEVALTPNKVFTSPDLNRDYVKKDEYTASLVFEKYHRFSQSQSWPATFIVAEYMYKSESDMFGRLLEGMGGDVSHGPTGVDHGFHAFALAFQQPFPNLVWRGDLSILADVQGGVFVQPGVKWRPSSSWTVDVYANVVLAKQNNKNIQQTFDYANEISARVAYQF